MGTSGGLTPEQRERLQRVVADYEGRWRCYDPARNDTPPTPEAFLTQESALLDAARAEMRRLDGVYGRGSADFGVYREVEEIGRGGMGVVHRAWDGALDRVVALKTLRPECEADPEQRRRFLEEARSAARLDARSANVVELLHHGELAGRVYCSMPFFAGGSLDRRGLTPPREAAALAATIADAVAHAHSRGVIHRDLKPHNILLDEQGRPYVGDFGLACRVGAPGFEGVVGTPAYMAPEQLTDVPPTTAIDVYGIGGILHFLLTGGPPNAGLGTRDILDRLPGSEPPRLPPAVPPDLACVVRKCLARDPAGRYASAREAADDLRRWLAGEPVRAANPGPVRRAWLWVRRNPAATGTLVLALAAAAGYAATLHFNNLALAREAERTRAQRDAARENLAKAREAVHTFLLRVGADDRLKEHDLEALRRDLLRPAVPFLEALAARADGGDELRADRARANGLLGEILAQTGDRNAARSHHALARDGFAELAPDDPAVLSDWASAIEHLANLADDADDALALHREALTIRARLGDGVEARRLRAKSHGNIANRLAGRGDPEAGKGYLEAIDSLKGAESAGDLGDLGASHANYALWLVRSARPDRFAKAAAHFAEAVKVGERLVAAEGAADAGRFRLATWLDNLASFQADTGDRASAATYARAEAVLADLTRRHPTISAYADLLANVRSNVAMAQAEAGDPAAAETFAAAVRARERLLDGRPGDAPLLSRHANTLSLYGLHLRDAGDVREAEKVARRAVEASSAAAGADAKNLEYRAQLADARNTLAGVLRWLGQEDLADKEVSAVLELREKIVAAADTPDRRDALAGALVNAALGLSARDPAAAVSHLRRACEIRDALCRDYPEPVQYLRGLGVSRYHLGLAAWNAGDLPSAEREYGKSLVPRREALRRTNTAADRRNVAASLDGLGLAEARQGKPGAAKTWSEAAELLAKDESWRPAREQLARVRHNLATSYRRAKRFDDADREYLQATRLRATMRDRPVGAAEYLTTAHDRATLHAGNGDADKAKAILDGAIAAHAESAKRWPGHPALEAAGRRVAEARRKLDD